MDFSINCLLFINGFYELVVCCLVIVFIVTCLLFDILWIRDMSATFLALGTNEPLRKPFWPGEEDPNLAKKTGSIGPIWAQKLGL